MGQNKDQSSAAVRGEAVTLTDGRCDDIAGEVITRIAASKGMHPSELSTDVKGHATLGRELIRAGFSARAADALDSQPTFAEGWVLAKETVIEMPNGKKELGYTLMEGVGIFTSFDEIAKAIKELSLPLGWVGMTTLQLLPGWQIPEAPASSQPTDGGVRNG